MKSINLDWLIETFNASKNKSTFFKNLERLSGTKKMQEQIESGMTTAEIRKTWKNDIESFKKTRAKYLIYN